MRTLPQVALFSLAVLGGLYSGLFSCGGHVWAWDAYLVVATASAVAVATVRRQAPVVPRLGVVGLAIVVFVLVQAAAGPFYPSAPSSLTDYGVGFIRVLRSGAC